MKFKSYFQIARFVFAALFVFAQIGPLAEASIKVEFPQSGEQPSFYLQGALSEAKAKMIYFDLNSDLGKENSQMKLQELEELLERVQKQILLAEKLDDPAYISENGMVKLHRAYTRCLAGLKKSAMQLDPETQVRALESYAQALDWSKKHLETQLEAIHRHEQSGVARIKHELYAYHTLQHFAGIEHLMYLLSHQDPKVQDLVSKIEKNNDFLLTTLPEEMTFFSKQETPSEILNLYGILLTAQVPVWKRTLLGSNEKMQELASYRLKQVVEGARWLLKVSEKINGEAVSADQSFLNQAYHSAEQHVKIG